MKIKSLCLFVFTCFYVCAQNEYVLNNKVEKITKLSPEQLFVRNNFPYKKASEWEIGMKFIVDSSSDDNDKFVDFSPKLCVNKNKNGILVLDSIRVEKVERIGRSKPSIDSILYFSCNKSIYKFNLSDLSYRCIMGIIYLGDIDISRNYLIGKKIYILENSWRSDNPNIVINKYERKYVPVLITKIGVSDYQETPVRVFFKYTDREFFIDVALSKINSSLIFDMYDFSNIFSFSNPRSRCKNTSDRIWELICKGKVCIGMTMRQCIMSWGEPEKKNKTISGHSVNEQWVYGYGSYLYFSNGLLENIQK